MSKSTMFLIGGLLVAVLVVGGALLLVNRPNSNTTTTTTSTPTPTSTVTTTIGTTTTPTTSLQQLTMAFVSTKTSTSDCYVVYDGGVYKVPSSWFGEHPGGSAAIAQYCGKDLTSAFDSNPEHRSDADAMLQSFYVGELVN